MKVLLVSVNNEKEPYPVAPLGAACVAHALRQAGHSVELLDLCFAEEDCRAAAGAVDRFRPDVIGLSIRNIDNLTYNKSVSYMPRLGKITCEMRRHTSSPIVAGGSGFSIFPEEVLRYLELETGIVGEGETAFVRFVDALSRDEEVSGIANLCVLDDGEFRMNGIDYEERPGRADRSLLANDAYLSLGGMGNIQAKRGCPFTCVYCTYPSIEGRTLRLRNPSEVVEELREMSDRYGIDHVFFVDDVFNFPEEHAAAVCEEMLVAGLTIGWTCFATPKGLTKELARLMKKAGCKGVEFGSDAGSGRTLEGLGKLFGPDDIAHAAQCCREIDLPNAHYVIIGGPEENESTLLETFSLFEAIKPTAVIAMVGVRIYPNTKLYDRALSEHLLEKGNDLLSPAFYLTPQMDAEDLIGRVCLQAGRGSNWVAPGLGINCDATMLSFLRKMGGKGPLWNMLS